MLHPLGDERRVDGPGGIGGIVPGDPRPVRGPTPIPRVRLAPEGPLGGSALRLLLRAVPRYGVAPPPGVVLRRPADHGQSQQRLRSRRACVVDEDVRGRAVGQRPWVRLVLGNVEEEPIGGAVARVVHPGVAGGGVPSPPVGRVAHARESGAAREVHPEDERRNGSTIGRRIHADGLARHPTRGQCPGSQSTAFRHSPAASAGDQARSKKRMKRTCFAQGAACAARAAICLL